MRIFSRNYLAISAALLALLFGLACGQDEDPMVEIRRLHEAERYAESVETLRAALAIAEQSGDKARIASALASLSESFARLIRAKNPPSLTRTSLFLMTQDQRFDVSRARRDLGWQSKVSMEEGVRLTAEWARRQGLA